MDSFGPALRQLRRSRGLSLRALSAQVAYDYGYLGQIERGDRPPTAAVAAACDRALDADGALVGAYHEQAAGEGDMRRRTVLQVLAGMAAAGTSPLVSLEALRQGLGQALDADHDSWRAVVAEYGRAYYTTPPTTLAEQITADLTVLQQMISVESGVRREGLIRASSQLSVLLAMALSATGDTHLAARWWASARLAARQSHDIDTEVLVGAWEMVNAIYAGRPLSRVIVRADETIALAGTRVNAAVAGVLAGRAQALALVGRSGDAETAVQQVARVTDAMPNGVVADEESVFGWPEHRLRHTESFVHTHTGNTEAAMAAQDRALALYPACQVRLRTQVQLHHATCLVKRGEIGDGVRRAAQLLDELPGEHHTTNLRRVATQLIAAVPAAEQRRPEVRDMSARLADGPAV
ncbi:helix-turn-helix transcriptional regulator [Micromonospora sp. NPDC049679]|uniref:helix-turn-helix transcriptional regulator n=1 Tax=Micromonospora sp. NPDC049679 TaxID=3155920 RepID=UPI0033D298F1